jgi:dipeptidyl aminopeptidase/acylaminoacyl peptidase
MATLLIHGKNDEAMSYAESVNLYREAEKMGKNVSLKQFDDGPHGFIIRNSNEAEKAYGVTERFFQK